MLQIENEYGNVESSFGQREKDYVKWAARMALELECWGSLGHVSAS